MKINEAVSGHSSRGFSLIELMISIVLGLLILAATLSIFSSNKQAYRTTENLGRVQENARIAFEMLGNDVREASGTQCSRGIEVVSALNSELFTNVALDNWTDWVNPLRGFDNTGPNASDTLQILAGGEDMFHVNTHDDGTKSIDINSTQAHDFVAGDIAIICDYRQAAIFEVQAVAGDVVTHTAGGKNATANLGVANSSYTFNDNATVSRINATQWFVRASPAPRVGNSLIRSTLRNVGGTSQMVEEEIADGVNNMQITYLLEGATTYVNAAGVPPFVAPPSPWENVVAVRIAITFESQDAIGISPLNAPVRIQRPMIQTFNLRNRTP